MCFWLLEAHSAEGQEGTGLTSGVREAETQAACHKGGGHTRGDPACWMVGTATAAGRHQPSGRKQHPVGIPNWSEKLSIVWLTMKTRTAWTARTPGSP